MLWGVVTGQLSSGTCHPGMGRMPSVRPGHAALRPAQWGMHTGTHPLSTDRDVSRCQQEATSSKPDLATCSPQKGGAHHCASPGIACQQAGSRVPSSARPPPWTPATSMSFDLPLRSRREALPSECNSCLQPKKGQAWTGAHVGCGLCTNGEAASLPSCTEATATSSRADK